MLKWETAGHLYTFVFTASDKLVTGVSPAWGLSCPCVPLRLDYSSDRARSKGAEPSFARTSIGSCKFTSLR